MKPLAVGGYSLGDSIILVDKYGDENAGVAHEMAHVLIHQRVAKSLNTVLNEGFACWMEAELANSPRHITCEPKIGLRELSYYWIFHEYFYTDNVAFSVYDLYATAYSFANYLITLYGLPRYLELCKAVGESKDKSAGAAFDEGMKIVYQKSLSEMEKSWRLDRNLKQLRLHLDVKSEFS